MKMQNTYRNLVVLIGLCILFSTLFDKLKEQSYNLKKSSSVFQTEFLKLEKSADILLNSILTDFEENGLSLLRNRSYVSKLSREFEENGRVILISQADSILFLSHNALPIDHKNLPRYNLGMAKYPNGWYNVVSVDAEDLSLWVFTRIKSEYPFKNKFLRNDFHQQLSLPPFFDISTDSASDGFMIFDLQGDYALTLLVPDNQNLSYNNRSLWLLSVLFAVGAILLVLLTVTFFFSRIADEGKIFLSLAGYAAAIVLLRFVMFYFQVPHILFSGDLFSASHYATSYWLPSLGDLFLNVFFFLIYVAFLVIKTNRVQGNSDTSFTKRFVSIVFAVFIIFFGARIVIYILTSLVINSSLDLNVRFIFNPDIYHVLGFLILTGSFISYYFLVLVVSRVILKDNLKSDGKLLVFGLFVLFVLVGLYFESYEYQLLWLGVIVSGMLSILFLPTRSMNGFSMARFMVALFFFSLIATYGLYIANDKKEISTRRNVALRIASEQDPVAEFLFHEIEKDLLDDYLLSEIVMEEPYNDERILLYLKEFYFDDFWARYDLQVTTCFPGEMLIFNPFNEEMVCDDYFSHYVENFGKPTISSYFHYLDNNTGRNSYLAVVPIKNFKNKKIQYTLYLEFESRFIPKELGFPELLVDEKINITRNLGNYSYAIYKNKLLTHKYGSYFFGMNADNYVDEESQIFTLFTMDGYSHLLYRRDDDTIIVVSRPTDTMLEIIAPFSYVFVFFLLYAIIIWLLFHFFIEGGNISFNFKKRLQMSIISIVLISVVSIGSASAGFIFNIYKNKNEAIINEKAHSILIELENHLAQEKNLNDSYVNYLNQLLLTLSNIFFTDINIFSIDGNILASSRPKIFNEGLIASRIHPEAFHALKVSGKSLYIDNEKIGNLQYLSAYVPLRNVEGKLIAYINLPYFAQQSELRNEISYFLVAFINIYLLLLLISVVIAYFISSHVTRPLQIIRDSISKIRIGKTNEKIEWTRDDEIGQLIAEYNRMINELSISAELLARSERESAWREMAKQVAHEIKNPLTPMRLNVQYLQRAWQDRVGDWDERLNRFTKTMVEQIDSLSIIASQFSDFAQMPLANNDIINLSEFLHEIPDMYKGSENLAISVEVEESDQPMLIYADRAQLRRVFTNLINNAIQAYPKSTMANVQLCSRLEKKYCITEVRDFGEGIIEDLQKNIFQPYFTTKTAGMGLGLALVKSIVESFNGHISFQSARGNGTTFFIRLPLSNNTDFTSK
jgi:two-component system, NtrC family, nitrogen regulation sensor histidine kinase NtrY